MKLITNLVLAVLVLLVGSVAIWLVDSGQLATGGGGLDLIAHLVILFGMAGLIPAIFLRGLLTKPAPGAARRTTAAKVGRAAVYAFGVIIVGMALMVSYILLNLGA